jgi:hypothetical protein
VDKINSVGKHSPRSGSVRYVICKNDELWMSAISLHSEIMAEISPFIIKSKSRKILDVCCTPEKIWPLKGVLFSGYLKNGVSHDKPLQGYLHYPQMWHASIIGSVFENRS